jgi:hypothetical protein
MARRADVLVSTGVCGPASSTSTATPDACGRDVLDLCVRRIWHAAVLIDLHAYNVARGSAASKARGLPITRMSRDGETGRVVSNGEAPPYGRASPAMCHLG